MDDVIGYLLLGVIAILAVVLLILVLRTFKTPEKGTQDVAGITEKAVELGGRITMLATNISSIQKDMGEITRIGETLSRTQEEIRKVLGSDRARGAFGEKLLKVELDNLLPRGYHENYEIDGNRVEYAIDMGNGMVLPIDAKFPSDMDEKNVKRKMKDKIKDVSDKYIKPGKTTDYTVLYVPTEDLFAEIIKNSDVMEYANDRKVMFASPTTVFYIITMIKEGLIARVMPEKFETLRNNIERLQSTYTKFESEHKKLVGHVRDAHNKISVVEDERDRLSRDIINCKYLTEKKEE